MVFSRYSGFLDRHNIAEILLKMGLNTINQTKAVIQGFLKKNENKLTRSFNFTFCYIYDVLSLNNSKVGDFINRIYYTELEIKDTTDIARSALYLDLHLEIDSEYW